MVGPTRPQSATPSDHRGRSMGCRPRTTKGWTRWYGAAVGKHSRTAHLCLRVAMATPKAHRRAEGRRARVRVRCACVRVCVVHVRAAGSERVVAAVGDVQSRPARACAHHVAQSLVARVWRKDARKVRTHPTEWTPSRATSHAIAPSASLPPYAYSHAARSRRSAVQLANCSSFA